MPYPSLVVVVCVLMDCAGAGSSISISPQSQTVFEGETAVVVCHETFLVDFKRLSLVDYHLGILSRPVIRPPEPQDKSQLINVTFHLPNMTRKEDHLRLRCLQLEFSSSGVSEIRVFGEWWV